MPGAKSRSSSSRSPKSAGERYRRLPTGAHGIDPEEVKRDQRERLQSAIVELIAERGYRAVRILDLTKLARVSRPTFYSLYDDKEELLLAAYDEIAQRTAKTVIAAYAVRDAGDAPNGRLQAAIRAFAELAASAPEATSLMVLGAFGAGPKAIERRNHTLEALERSIRVSRDGASSGAAVGAGGRRGKAKARVQAETGKESGEDLTVKVILGGIREVTAARLRQGRAEELPGLAGELATWAACYPVKLPAGLRVAHRRPHRAGGIGRDRNRRRRAPHPSGRCAPKAACRAGATTCRVSSSSKTSASESSTRPPRSSPRRALPASRSPRSRAARTSPTRPSTRCTRPSTTPSSAPRRSACTRRWE